MNKCKNFFNFLDQYAELSLMYISSFFLIAAVMLQIITRVTMTPFSWTEEVARYSFVWLTFFGISYGIRDNSHIRFDMLLNKAKPKTGAVIDLLQAIVMLAIWGLVFYICIEFIGFTYANKAPALHVTIAIRNLSVVAGGICCICRLIQKIVLNILFLTGKRPTSGFAKEEE